MALICNQYFTSMCNELSFNFWTCYVLENLWACYYMPANIFEFCKRKHVGIIYLLTLIVQKDLSDDAWVCGPDWAPQKLKLHPKFTLWNENICKKKLFTMLSFWGIAVCLHIRAKFKMAARGPERVAGEVFYCFLLPTVVYSC